MGAVHAAWANRVATTLAFAGAGAALMNVIGLVPAPHQHDRSSIVWMTGIGIAFGLAGAYGVARKA